MTEPMQPAEFELPGMWESADLSGGWADTEDMASDFVPACETFTEGVVRGFCRLCGQIPADHPHGEIRDQDAVRSDDCADDCTRHTTCLSDAERRKRYEAEYSEEGEPDRAFLGIDGTMGDAQDVPHPFISSVHGDWCRVCGLVRRHIDGSREAT